MKPRKEAALLMLVTAFGACLFDRVPAEAGSSSPAKETCVTASCHAAMGKAKFVHGPVAVGDCASCHVLTGKHAFKPIKDVVALCTTCHPKADLTASHASPRQPACTRCHDPHQSDNSSQLRSMKKGTG